MFRVLHIMSGADAGGISTVVLNYYRFMNRDCFHFDIALTTKVFGQNGAMLEQLGAKTYYLPLKSHGIKKYEVALKRILKSNSFDAVHVHENETSYIALKVAKDAGVPCRIAHAHTTVPVINLKSEIKRLSGCFFNYKYATTVIACGQMAGNRVFGNYNMRRSKAVVLSNAIDTLKFKYDVAIRNKVRRNLGVCDKFVIGFVGRLSKQKNHLFALRFLKNLIKIKTDVVLMIVGNGEEELELKSYVKENELDCYVKFLGRRADVNELYQAFDLLVMPSLYEGFPVTAVEAISSGLTVFLSDKITKELEFSKFVKYLPLDEIKWVEAISKFQSSNLRFEGCSEMRKNKFDIHVTVKMLEEIYRKDIDDDN